MKKTKIIKKIKKEIQVAYPVFTKNEIAFVQKRVPIVLKGKLSTGPFTKQFEKEFSKFIGAKYAVFLNSCTSALEISLRYLNLKKNDEVIVPTQSFIADGSCVVTNNAKIIFANINKETFCLDLNEIKRRVTKKTKAIILVYFGGYMPHDIEKIKDFCKKKKIFLLEDCSHSIGSQFKYLKSGSVGDCGCFSFFSTKTITTGEGGMITTNNKKLYEFAIAMRDRGRKINYPFEIYDKIWRNCRVPELSALVGLSQFRNIKKINAHRAKIVKVYNNYCKNSEHIETLPLIKKSKLSIWKHIILIKNRKIKRQILQKNLKLDYNVNINWAYYPLLHKQPIFRKNFNKNYLKKTEKLCDNHFHLPLHMNISLKDAHYVISALDLSIKKLLNE